MSAFTKRASRCWRHRKRSVLKSQNLLSWEINYGQSGQSLHVRGQWISANPTRPSSVTFVPHQKLCSERTLDHGISSSQQLSKKVCWSSSLLRTRWRSTRLYLSLRYFSFIFISFSPFIISIYVPRCKWNLGMNIKLFFRHPNNFDGKWQIITSSKRK